MDSLASHSFRVKNFVFYGTVHGLLAYSSMLTSIDVYFPFFVFDDLCRHIVDQL
jgi:hypothetical protein